MQIQEQKLKILFKSIIKESLEAEKRLIYKTLYEVIEDIAMAKAINEGKNTKIINKKEIYKLLEI